MEKKGTKIAYFVALGLIIVLLVKAIGLIGAKTEEVRQRTKRRH